MERWIIYALISMLFAGFTSVIAKYGMKNVGGDTALVVRTSMVFLLVWLNAFIFNHTKGLTVLTKKDILFLCLFVGYIECRKDTAYEIFVIKNSVYSLNQQLNGRFRKEWWLINVN